MRTRLDFFNEHAESWGAGWDIVGMQERLARELVEFGIASGESVLDLGCGTGILLHVLLEHLSRKGQIHAVDFSPAMLEVAGHYFTDSRLHFHLADGAAIPLPDGSIDTVLCFSAFPHFVDRGPVLHELKRLLHSGGHLHIWHHEDSAVVNARHAVIDPTVAHDHLEHVAELGEKAVQCGFIVETALENKNLYHLALRA